VRKLTFTGSTPVGKELMAKCAATVKRTSMELGGNAPFIVFDDADLDAAVAGAIASKYRNAGQTCVCANRMLVQDGVYEAFTAKLAAAVAQFRLGDGAQDGINMGPLIDEGAANEVMSFVEDAVAKGATVVTGGTRGSLGGSFVRADHPHQCLDRHARLQRGDLRPGRTGVPLLHRGRGHRARQRHGVRSRLVLLRARHRPHLARGRGRWNTASSASTRASSPRGRTLRRREGVRTPAARAPSTASTTTSRSSTCASGDCEGGRE
jgi:hypothetical protein